MLNVEQLKGVIPAIVTPFDEDDKVDMEALEELTDYLLRSGVHAIMTTGGNGEFPHLSRQEKATVTQVVVEKVARKIPVIAGTAACSTKETVLLCQDAEEAGADAVIITEPYFFKLPEESLYQHYRDIARAVDLPVVIYNNPLYTGNNLTPDMVGRLAEVDGIIGLKQSNSDLGQFVEAVRMAGEKIALLTGIDSQFYPSLCVGGKGIFSTAACLVPGQMVSLYEAFKANDHTKALQIHLQLQGLNKFLEYDPGYVAPCKEGLEMMGFKVGSVRKPLPELTSKERQSLKRALLELGVVKS
jgi:4-hydroxy-tetrahydrodipicolinate synthase